LKAVFGLGNPGLRYALTRHNVGFQVIDLYRKVHRLKEKGRITCSSLIYRREDLFLVKPMTYMNASGEAVKAVLESYKITVDDALVVYDDLDFPLGRMRVLPGGGAGTHKGMLSVLSAIESEKIPRLRIGIGAEHREQDAVSYVLDRFAPREWEKLFPVLKRAVDVIEAFRSSEINAVMTCFNRRDRQVATERNTGTLKNL
jgi:PTH1 family peptidyl-tRNA hydrolase